MSDKIHNKSTNMIDFHIVDDSLEKKSHKELVPFESADSLNNRALLALESDTPEAAIHLWNQALIKDPKHVDAFFNRELWLLRSEKKSAALAAETLARFEAGRNLGLVAALSRETGGEASVAKASIRKAVFPNALVVASRSIGNEILAGISLAQTSVVNYVRYDKGSGKLLWQDELAYGVENGNLITCAISPDGRYGVSYFNSGMLQLYDMMKEKIIQTVGAREMLKVIRIQDITDPPSRYMEPNVRLHFSRDSRLLVMEKGFDYCLLFSFPDIKLIKELRQGIFFVCFTPDNLCVIREKQKNKREILLSVDADGNTREVFRFEKPLETIVENTCSPEPFLCYRYTGTKKHPGACFRLDLQFQPHPLTPAFFPVAAGISQRPFYDPLSRLLYTRSATEDNRIEIWDLDSEEKKLTSAFPDKWWSDVKENRKSYWLTDSVYAEGRWTLCLSNHPSSRLHELSWIEQQLPSMIRTGEKSLWRHSPIPVKDTVSLLATQAAQRKELFEKSFSKSSWKEALKQFRLYRELPGAFGCADDLKMEDILDHALQKDRLRSVRELEPLKNTPSFSLGRGEELIHCGRNLLALCKNRVSDIYIRQTPPFVHFFTSDGVPVRSVPLKENIRFAAVRQKTIFAFYEDKDCELTDPEGNVLPLPWEDWPRESTYFDLDTQGNQLLYRETRYGHECRLKDLNTGVESIISDDIYGNEKTMTAGILYNGNIVCRNERNFLVLFSPAEKQILSELDICCRDLCLDETRRYVLCRSEKYPQSIWTVFDANLNQLAQWEDEHHYHSENGYHTLMDADFVPLPGTCLLAFSTRLSKGYHSSVISSLHIQDFLSGKRVFSTPLADIKDIRVRPDSRELYVVADDGVRVFRLEYDYMVPDQSP